jgi:hypothetical protein
VPPVQKLRASSATTAVDAAQAVAGDGVATRAIVGTDAELHFLPADLFFTQANRRWRRAMGCAPIERIAAGKQAMLPLPPDQRPFTIAVQATGS